MGVGFSITGTVEEGDPDEWVRRAADWLRDYAGEPLEGIHLTADEDDAPTLFALLHPAAPAVRLQRSGATSVRVEAKTSTAGPGYHIYCCDLFKQLGEDLAVEWDVDQSADETGYFFHGRAADVETEMAGWLGRAARALQSMAGNDNYGQMMISMPVHHRYPGWGPLLTPLGPRDREWIDAVTADARAGTDIFPWRESGPGVEFLLGRALGRMWTGVRWRPPVNDAETELHAAVLRDLHRAFSLSPTRPYPWREWHELLGYAREAGVVIDLADEVISIVADRAKAATGSLIGYRRGQVRVEVADGWSLEVPGSLAEMWEEDGAWTAWDGTRTVWVTVLDFEGDEEIRPSAVETLAGAGAPAGNVIEHHAGEVVGLAGFGPHREDGKDIWRLSARSAVAGRLAVCDVFLDDPADREWAVGVWQSLGHGRTG